jgi:predicted RNA-binding protein with PUA-like domain
MAYWLLKTEPEVFSWADQVARDREGEIWSGVRNHQAKNFIKAMGSGDQGFFYHTGSQRAIVGIVDILTSAFPDPTDEAWLAVTVMARLSLHSPVTLTQIKAHPALAEMALLKQSRLSVQPVTAKEWDVILGLGGVGYRT